MFNYYTAKDCYNKGYRDIGYHVPQFNCQSCHDLWPESCQVTGVTLNYVLSCTLSDCFIQGADINLNDVVMDRWYSSVTVDYCFHWTYQSCLIICLGLESLQLMRYSIKIVVIKLWYSFIYTSLCSECYHSVYYQIWYILWELDLDNNEEYTLMDFEFIMLMNFWWLLLWRLPKFFHDEYRTITILISSYYTASCHI